MADFPTTTDELEQYISDYMDAHIAERVVTITDDAIARAVKAYMEDYGAALEDNGTDGDVPLVPDNYFVVEGGARMGSTTMPLTENSNGVPTRYIQARISALAQAAASLVSAGDIPMRVVLQTASEAEIQPNVLNIWGDMTQLTVAFSPGKEGAVNEYLLQFSCGTEPTELTMPSSVKWVEEPDFEPGYVYQVSVVNNLAVVAGWDKGEV